MVGDIKSLFGIKSEERPFNAPQHIVKAVLRFMSGDRRDFEVIQSEEFNTMLGLERGSLDLADHGISLEYELLHEGLEVEPKADELYQVLWAFDISYAPGGYWSFEEDGDMEIRTLEMRIQKMDSREVQYMVEAYPYLEGCAV